MYIVVMSKREVHKETPRGAQRNHIAPWVPSENHANTIGKRDVFENAAVAGTFLRFRALKTVEILCFLSSPTCKKIRITPTDTHFFKFF